MGWGIDFNSDIFLSRQSYSSKGEVEDRINEISKSITDCENLLMMYASATPKDVVSTEDSENIVNFLNNKILELLEEHEDLIIDRFKLNLYLEFLNEGGIIEKDE